MNKPDAVLTEVHKDHIIGLARMHCGDHIADALAREFAKLAEKAEPMEVVYQIRHKFCPQWTACDERTYSYNKDGATGAEVRKLGLYAFPPTDTALLTKLSKYTDHKQDCPARTGDYACDCGLDELRAAIKAHKGEA